MDSFKTFSTFAQGRSLGLVVILRISFICIVLFRTSNGIIFLAITASIVQRMERLLCLLHGNKQVYGELFLSHVFVIRELSNVA